MRFIVVITIALCAVSCRPASDLAESLDAKFFESFGVTLFSRPEVTTLKEIHLESSMLFGQNVVVEGNIEETGRFLTYIVVKDATAKILVALTDLNSFEPLTSSSHQATKVRIWGNVESGKKGLPIILAKAISVVKDDNAKISK